jgi:hypothetical protein
MSIGQWVTDNYGSGPQIKSNTGASWIGELYFNFGYPGLVIGMLILGVWFRFLQEHFFGPDATIPSLLMAISIVTLSAQTPGGSISSPVNGPVYTFIPITFTHLMIRALSPQRGPPRASPIGVERV